MDKLDKDSKTAQFAKDFQSFLDVTQAARENSELVRDFRDLRQWTAEEEATLLGRNQTPVVFDYIGEAVDYMVGLERDLRQDPKAYPRNRDDEGGAQAVSDALRYVADNNDFDDVASEVFEDKSVEGIGAGIVEVKEKRDGDFDITITRIPWDRFYYDPHSRMKNFKDACFMGRVVWMDADKVKEKYPDASDDIADRLTGDVMDGDTYEDRPVWFDTGRNRVRVCEHYYKEGDEWYICIFSGDVDLVPSRETGYVDEDGHNICPIEAQSDYVDRDNERYGYFKRYIDPQREVNARRSKALFLLSARQVIYEEGAVKDVHDFKEELKKPDGAAEVNPGALTDGSVQVSQTGDMANGQVAMYQDAVAKVDRMGANAAMQGDVEGMSGRAIQRAQVGGQAQVGPIFDNFRSWKRRIYRQVWFRVKQFWDAEKWIRVTDNEDNLKWVGLNTPVTMGEELQEAAKAGDQMAGQMLQQMMATQDPRLNEQVRTKNEVAKLDLDVIIAEGPDVITSAEEQFQGILAIERSQPGTFPPEMLIEMSSLPNKKQILDKMGDDEGQMAQMAQMQQQIQQMQTQLQMALGQAEIENKEADTANKQADTAKKMAEAEKTAIEAQGEILDNQQTAIETEILRRFPDLEPNLII